MLPVANGIVGEVGFVRRAYWSLASGWMGRDTHRMVDSPHDHAEQGVAGTEQLHFLGDEVFLLGLGLARDGCGDAGRRSHVQGKVAAVGGVEIEAVVSLPPPLEAGSAANDSRLANCAESHPASEQNSSVPNRPPHPPSVRGKLGDATLTRAA